MAAPRKNPYRGEPRRKGNGHDYVFRSLRVFPDFWQQLEILAAREQVSMNSLCMALFELALELDQTDEGRERIHAACTAWRTRWEHKGTAKRRAKAAPAGEEEL